MISILGFAALGLAWLLPGHYFPWRGFQQETLAAVGAALVAAGVLVRSDVRLALPRSAALILALALVPMLQWAAGRIPYLADALLPALYLGAFALAIIAGRAATELDRDHFVGGLFAAAIVAALISTGIGLAQWLRLGEIAYVEMLQDGGRIYGNFTQPNHLASLLGLGFVGILWCFEARRIGGAGAVLALCFVGFGIVMTQSRTSWALAAALALWWLAMRRRLALRTPGAAVSTGVAVFAGATFAWPLMNAWMDQGGVSVAERAQAGTRPIHWVTLWDAAWREPFLGYGWQQVGVAQQAATLDHPAAHEWITFSHNLGLDLMVWNGALPGLLLGIAVAVWAARRLFRCRNVHGWALLAAGAVLVIHALVEFPLAYAYFLLPFGLMIGAVDALESEPGRRPPASVPRAAYAATLAAMVAMLAWVSVEYLEVEDAAREMAFKEAGYVTRGPALQLPDVMLLDNQREFIWFRMNEARPGMSEEAVNRMKTLSQRFAPPAAMLRYAMVAGLNGREADAARNLVLICHMWPARNCEEGRASWFAAQARYPQLRQIPFPSSQRSLASSPGFVQAQ